MLSTLNITNSVHVAALKVLGAKAAVGVGMVVGTVATGVVAYTTTLPDYVDSAANLVNNAIVAESPTYAASFTLINDKFSTRTPATPIEPGSMHTPAATEKLDQDSAKAIPQVVVTGHRMSRANKIAYDLKHGLAIVLASQ